MSSAPRLPHRTEASGGDASWRSRTRSAPCCSPSSCSCIFTSPTLSLCGHSNWCRRKRVQGGCSNGAIRLEWHALLNQQRALPVNRRTATPRAIEAAYLPIGRNDSVSRHLLVCETARSRSKRVLAHALADGSCAAAGRSCHLAVRGHVTGGHAAHEREDLLLEGRELHRHRPRGTAEFGNGVTTLAWHLRAHKNNPLRPHSLHPPSPPCVRDLETLKRRSRQIRRARANSTHASMHASSRRISRAGASGRGGARGSRSLSRSACRPSRGRSGRLTASLRTSPCAHTG